MTTGRLPKATHGSPQTPLDLGGIRIPCFVLDDGRRALSRRGVLGIEDRAPLFLGGGLDELTVPTIRFQSGDEIVCGFDAVVLPEVCATILAAAREGRIPERRLAIAGRCATLMGGLARVGIVSLVDEVTGFSPSRRTKELHRVLAAHLDPELCAWTWRFPTEFYEELVRLLGWVEEPAAIDRSTAIAWLTNLVIYGRLPSAVVEELRLRDPADLVSLMRSARTWHAFTRLLARRRPAPELPRFAPDELGDR